MLLMFAPGRNVLEVALPRSDIPNFWKRESVSLNYRLEETVTKLNFFSLVEKAVSWGLCLVANILDRFFFLFGCVEE